QNFYSNYEIQKQSVPLKYGTLLDQRVADRIQRWERVKNRLDIGLKRIQTDIQEWKTHKISSSVPFDFKYEPSEMKKILTQEKWLKKAARTCFVAGVILAVVGIAALSVAFALADGGATLSLFTRGIITGIAVGGSAVGGLSCLIGILLNTSSAIRKARVANDSDFKEFIESHLIEFDRDTAQFYPSEKDLMDRKLHNIYLKYKELIETLPRS
ncbi:MAG: hypothetical protein ACE5GN_05315, partial [Waddliaceae bacterium]